MHRIDREHPLVTFQRLLAFAGSLERKAEVVEDRHVGRCAAQCTSIRGDGSLGVSRLPHSIGDMEIRFGVVRIENEDLLPTVSRDIGISCGERLSTALGPCCDIRQGRTGFSRLERAVTILVALATAAGAGSIA